MASGVVVVLGHVYLFTSSVLQETLKKWPDYAKLACKESAREFLDGTQKMLESWTSLGWVGIGMIRPDKKSTLPKKTYM